MEITTCEQYVLNRVKELDDEVERLRVELLKRDKEVTELQDIVTTYDEIVRVYGEKDVFTHTTKIEVDVHSGYSDEEDEYYNFLMNRNEKYLEVRDYSEKSEVIE